MKKSRDIKNIIAERLSYDKDIIDAVIDFYWSTVRKKLSSLDFHRVYIESLGDFYIRQKPLNIFIEKQIYYIAKLDRTNFQSFPRYQEAQEKLLKLKNIQQVIDLETLRKNQIKNERVK